MFQAKDVEKIKTRSIFYFKPSPCSKCCMLSSRLFPVVWILCADVSEHCLFHLHRQVVVWRMN